MSGVLLDLSAKLGIPKSHCAVLPAAQHVFRRALGISDNVYCAFVVAQRCVQGAWQGGRTARRCHGRIVMSGEVCTCLSRRGNRLLDPGPTFPVVRWLCCFFASV